MVDASFRLVDAVGALGTNPIAIGVPTGDDTPFLIDFATSMIANGKTYVADSENRDLPEGCVVDKARKPRPSKPLSTAMVDTSLPFGRHKGYALSLFVCLLGGLAGTFNIDTGQIGGLYMQVIDVNAFHTACGISKRGSRFFRFDQVDTTRSGFR